MVTFILAKTSVALGFDPPTFFHQVMGVIAVKNLIKDRITNIIKKGKEFKMKSLIDKSITVVSAIVGYSLGFDFQRDR